MAAAFGFPVLALSRSGFAEIEAGLSFLIATVAMGCAAIIYQLKKTKPTSSAILKPDRQRIKALAIRYGSE